MKIFIDIETIPTQSPEDMQEIFDGIKPPGNISKPETIEKWMREKAAAEAEKQWRKTALSGTSGEIVVIGAAVEDGEAYTVQRDVGISEGNLLDVFWLGIADLVSERFPESSQVDLDGIKPLWIGHNVEFDVRFLKQRSIVHQIKPTLDIRPNERHGFGHLFCTMQEWAGYREFIKLDTLCKALGIENPKDCGMDGSKVYDAWIEGRVDEIAAYCKRDVEAVREIYRRMMFQEEA